MSAHSICIVANELPGFFKNGGIGTHNLTLAETLAEAGWSVHLLYTSTVDDQHLLSTVTRNLSGLGIRLHYMPAMPVASPERAHCPVAGHVDIKSLAVYRSLQHLHHIYQFDLVEFAEWNGEGFRAIQAKRTLGEFGNLRFIVRLHSSHQWCRDANQQWSDNVDECMQDYYERYSFENADIQMSPSEYMLQFARSIGWAVRPDAIVSPYRYPAPCFAHSERESSVEELVFFGRLELRKGIVPFVQAANRLPSDLRITFLGRESHIHAEGAGKFLSRSMRRDFSIISSLDRQEALEYLQRPGRLAVIPSLVENYPFTLIECVVNRIPFIASAVGGIPEIVSDATLQQQVLFKPDSESIVHRVRSHCQLSPSRLQALYASIHASTASNRSVDRVVHDYRSVVERERPARIECLQSQEPLVSIVIPYYNLPDYVSETFQSVVSQDYQNIEILVVDDGSTDERARRVVEQLTESDGRARLIRRENGGLSAARNTGLREARGDFFIPIDADNIACGNMVSVMLKSLQNNPDLDGVTCFFQAFGKSEDLDAKRFQYAYRPVGGPLPLAAIRNVFGDANAMFRTSVIRDAGGYNEERNTTCEDWELFVKLVGMGYRIDVIPEYLFYYRHREDSLLRTTDMFENRKRVLRQFFEGPALKKCDQVMLWSLLVGNEKSVGASTPAVVASGPIVNASRKRFARQAEKEVRRVMNRLKNGQSPISFGRGKKAQAA